MIDTIIFDFGDIFLNLNKSGCHEAFQKLGLPLPNEKVAVLSDLLERGVISETAFLDDLQVLVPNSSIAEIRTAWNSVIGDFPLYRLEFLQLLKTKYRLFLLTNTDKIHIEYFEDNAGISFFSAFYQCFEKVYYSYEMGLRKPDEAIYQRIIKKHNLNPQKTLFVDDKTENTDVAALCGLKIWNLQVGKDDVVELFEKKII